MRIAFLGSRGVPRCYSGFETFLDEMCPRLVSRGHEVTVYNRIPFNTYREPEYKGVKLVHMPTVPMKSTDTIVHSLLCTLHALFGRFDLVYYCGVGSSLVSVLAKIFGIKVVVNVDGADFERAKWSGFGRWWLKKSEQWAADLADAIIADNGMIQKRYQELYGVKAHLIPYGSQVVTDDPGDEALQKWGLTANDYFLYVSRLTPENAADLTMEAFLEWEKQCASASKKLVVIGDAPYQDEYLGKLRDLAKQSDNIIMTGYVFGEDYSQISFHALAFILPTAIEATRPVLLDQMGFGNCIIHRDTPGNIEVVDTTGVPFSHEDPVATLVSALNTVATDPDAAKTKGTQSRDRVGQHYDWDVLTKSYETLFQNLCT